jgi:pimeloyl-ACP methyl ester carboxylesterase
MIFLHGWRELGLIWRSQIRHFATKGWRCVAPDMCGYGRSSRPLSISAYCVRELVADMVKLQWDYWLYYREHFAQASQAFEVGVRATLSHLYRIAPPCEAGVPAFTADIRARGGWFGEVGKATPRPRDEALLDQKDFDSLVKAFSETGFSGADARYMNDAENLAFAAEAPDFGRIELPVLFIHATNDTVCDTPRSRLADPMREDCRNLSEVTVEGGHEIMLERLRR